MNKIFDWNLVLPPKNTWIWARYSTEKEFILVKTCNSGCCVYHDGVNLMIPNYWKEATQEEAIQEEHRCNEIQTIDVCSLYE